MPANFLEHKVLDFTSPTLPFLPTLLPSLTKHPTSHIPKEYHDFTDVFNKAKADTLAPHWPYDLKINLEEGLAPLIGAIYPLSQSELQTLREFIDEHLQIGFIRLTTSLHGAPVLFVRKKKTDHSVSVLTSEV